MLAKIGVSPDKQAPIKGTYLRASGNGGTSVGGEEPPGGCEDTNAQENSKPLDDKLHGNSLKKLNFCVFYVLQTRKVTH